MDASLSDQHSSNPSSTLSFWVSRSVKFLKSKAKAPSRSSSKRYHFDGMVVNNSAYCDSPSCVEEKMEDIDCELQEKDCLKHGMYEHGEDQSGESSSSSGFLASEYCLSEEVEKPHLDSRKLSKQGSSCVSESEMMKERFAKLLLGEDMSGCGNGVCTALAISNAITNLCATLFGQIWRLEPLQQEKKRMWRREMDWILCVSDHIVELVPSWQTFPDGTKLEVMTSRPRLDLYANLPALRKLDNMLLEILDSFEASEFWYVSIPDSDGAVSFRKPLPNQENKWWLPVPRVPPRGLTEDSRRTLQQKRDGTNQIHKAAMAINSAALAEMDVPDSYLESLPKNGKASLGEVIHRCISSDHFSAECLLDCLELSSEHHALEVANRLEAAVHLWRRKTSTKPTPLTAHRSNSRSSWEMVRDLMTDADKREALATRAESMLLCLKLRFPGLPQTTLDMTKILCNKDVGKSILESYSRVLESLAFNIVARIDDLLYVDDMAKHSDKLISMSKVGVITHESFAAQRLSSSPSITYTESSKLPLVKRVLTDYLSMDGKGKDICSSSSMERSDSFSTSPPSLESS